MKIFKQFLVKPMSYSKHRKLRLQQSTRLSPLGKANSTRRNLQSAIQIPTPILSVRFPKTGLPEIMHPQITIDRLLGHTVVQEQGARVARHSLSTIAPVVIEATEEVGITIEVEA